MRRIVILLLLALGIVCILGACSPQERRGISPLPQNRPASWEYNTLSQ